MPIIEWHHIYNCFETLGAQSTDQPYQNTLLLIDFLSFVKQNEMNPVSYQFSSWILFWET